MSEFLAALIEANVAAAAAIAFVLVTRGWVRRRSGAHASYLLWAIVPVAMLATMIPARTVVVPMSAVPPAFDGLDDVGLARAAPAFDWMQLVASALPWLWIGGLALTAAWLLLGQARFLGDVKRGKAGPAVVGLLRPHIVIPSDFGGRFEAREQELILAHERFHLARQDARLNTLVALARCVCWFNPMIHIGAHVMRIDQELSCDAAVVGRRPGARRVYAETLLKTQLASRPLPLGCYWPPEAGFGTQHPLTERIAMLTRTSPSRRTRLLASAAVVVITAGAGVAAWAVQPERTVLQEAPPAPARDYFAPITAPAPALDFTTPIEAPRAPAPLPAPERFALAEAPRAAPLRDSFAPVTAPEPPLPAPEEAPQPAPARDFFARVPEAPRAQPAPERDFFEPLEAPQAPQELTPAERDALMKEMEAQRKEMEAQRAQMEVQRAEFERQRVQMEAQRKEFETQRLQFETLRQKLNPDGPRPLDGAVLKEKLASPGRYKLALDKAQALEKVIKGGGEVVRNKIFTPGAGPAGPQKMAFKSLKDQLAEMRKAESLTSDKAAKAKLKEAIGILEELEKRGPNKAPDAPQ